MISIKKESVFLTQNSVLNRISYIVNNEIYKIK